MISYQDAISAARSLIGTPYAELDCINLIKKVIRTAPGGVKGYTTAGTNSLWKSFAMSRKYKDLTWRQKGLSGARAGMLAFKVQGDDVHHVGIVTERNTVIHASSVLGCTAETPLDEGEGWMLLAIHRYIDPAAETGTVGREREEERLYALAKITIVDSENNTFVPVGDFRVLVGSAD